MKFFRINKIIFFLLIIYIEPLSNHTCSTGYGRKSKTWKKPEKRQNFLSQKQEAEPIILAGVRPSSCILVKTFNRCSKMFHLDINTVNTWGSLSIYKFGDINTTQFLFSFMNPINIPTKASEICLRQTNRCHQNKFMNQPFFSLLPHSVCVGGSKKREGGQEKNVNVNVAGFILFRPYCNLTVRKQCDGMCHEWY